MAFFEKAIETMASSSLRCVAIAYRSYESEKVPTKEEELAQWAPENDLVLLAIVGIKVSITGKNYVGLTQTMHSFIYVCILFIILHVGKEHSHRSLLFEVVYVTFMLIY